MKKILFAISQLLNANSKQEGAIPIIPEPTLGSGIKVKNGIMYADIANIFTIDEFNYYKGNSTTITVKDDVRGGMFNFYEDNDVIDNGIVFKDALNRKWKRQLPNNKINIQWFGAKGTEIAPNDIYDAVIAARDYCYAHPGTVLYIPYAGGTYGYYYCSKTLDFSDHSIWIEGENSGSNNNTNSVIKFPANTTGFNFNRVGAANKFVTLKNIYIQGGGMEAGASYSTWDFAKHGIQINVNFLIENVFVTAFAGDAFHVTGGNGIGSTNRSVFRNCEGDYSLNGFYVQGNDANQILFDNCSGVQNKKWGFLDKSFLGNTYNNCHVATNAFQPIPNNDFVHAYYEGNTYVAVNLDEFNNTNFRPDLNPDKWIIFNNQGQYLQSPWDSTRRYYSGGAYCSTLDNASHVYTNCYSEGYQPPSRWASNSMILNGLQEAGGSGGARVFAGYNEFNFYSAIYFNKKVVFGEVKEYADNAAAIAAGLGVGTQYRTGDILKVVH